MEPQQANHPANAGTGPTLPTFSVSRKRGSRRPKEDAPGCGRRGSLPLMDAVLQVAGARKRFGAKGPGGGVLALDGVDLALR